MPESVGEHLKGYLQEERVAFFRQGPVAHLAESRAVYAQRVAGRRLIHYVILLASKSIYHT